MYQGRSQYHQPLLLLLSSSLALECIMYNEELRICDARRDLQGTWRYCSGSLPDISNPGLQVSDPVCKAYSSWGGGGGNAPLRFNSHVTLPGYIELRPKWQRMVVDGLTSVWFVVKNIRACAICL